MEKQRDIYIDVLKALAIFWVVLGHAPLCDGFVKQVIYSFHMPLFFAVYGFTYSIAGHQKRGFINKQFVSGKFKRLIIPAVVWSFGYTLCNDMMSGGLNVKHLLLDLYGSQAAYYSANSLSSIWFLPVMFLSVCAVEAVLSLIVKTGSSRQHKVIMLLLALFLPAITIFLPKFSIGYLGGGKSCPCRQFLYLVGNPNKGREHH